MANRIVLDNAQISVFRPAPERHGAKILSDAPVETTIPTIMPDAPESPFAVRWFWLVTILMFSAWMMMFQFPDAWKNETLRAVITGEQAQLELKMIQFDQTRKYLQRIRDNDPYLLEIVARNRLGWTRPDEQIELPTPSSSAAASAEKDPYGQNTAFR